MGISDVAVKSKSFALDPRQHPRYPPPRKTIYKNCEQIYKKNVDAMGRGMLLFVHGGNSNGNEIWRIYESVPNEKWNVA